MSQKAEVAYRLIPERFLAALGYRDFRTLWMASFCAGGAAWALIGARGWLAFSTTETNSSLVYQVKVFSNNDRFFPNF